MRVAKIEKYIFDELQKLKQVDCLILPSNFGDEIYRIIKSCKFRRVAASEILLKRIREAIDYNVSKNKPINITFLQGSYKLWRLEEAPEVDWAELFALMHYATWVKPILSFYKPGVVFDFYMDDLVMEKISNYRRDEILSYQSSFQKVIDFILTYCPDNLQCKITTVSSRYDSEKDFWNKLSIAVEKWKKPEDIKLDESLIAMIDLNYRPIPNEQLGGLWRQENMRIHDAHSAMAKRLEYRNETGKILAMPQHYSGADNRLFVGSTKDSNVKYWIGVGALRSKGEGYAFTVLSPGQLVNAKYSTHEVLIKGLNGKNFTNIRVLEEVKIVDFKKFSDNYDVHRVADPRVLQAIIDNLNLKKDMRILDFGCGTGNYLKALQDNGFKYVFGLDKEERMQEIAQKKTGATVKIGTHLDIPYESDYFDAVILVAMLHFVDDIDSLFKNLNRVCKKNGHILIITQSHHQVKARFYNKYFPSLIDIDTNRYYEPQSILEAAEANGFSSVNIQDYLSATDMKVDADYFNLIKNKSFFVLGLLSSEEFDKGMDLFKEDMAKSGGEFITKFAGWTLITLQKEKPI